MMKETGDRSLETGDRSQETGVRSQETGVRSQETGVRSQETGVEELAAHYHQILTLLGEDPEREGLLKTPMRVAKAMQVLT